jgi:alginate O-acetyltransferase complex protein AlgI
MEFKPNFKLMNSPKPLIRWASIMALLFIILVFGVFNGGQFIYFQF